ncbi:MAG: hypothetical protein HY897_24420 [Deltaproteobacteria bacterium]|nr:hypothetical protein [Deltaproteobacteria bacterium]
MLVPPRKQMIEATVTFLPKSEGGRNWYDGMLRTGQSWPHIVIGDPGQRKAIVTETNLCTEEYLGVAFTDGPEHVEPGVPTTVTMALVYWQPGFEYSAAVPGATFTLREGPAVIGFGTIARRWAGE